MSAGPPPDVSLNGTSDGINFTAPVGTEERIAVANSEEATPSSHESEPTAATTDTLQCTQWKSRQTGAYSCIACDVLLCTLMYFFVFLNIEVFKFELVCK